MKAALLAAAALLGAPLAAGAQDKEHAHPKRTFHMVRLEADHGRTGGEDVSGLDADAWFGGDRQKLWLKADGEIEDGDVHESRGELLYSRNVATFWDLQAGVRHDFEPGTTHLAVGVQGLAPYQFETEVFGYLSDDGVLSGRFMQSLDVHLTQRLILEPEIEVELQAQDAPKRGLGHGLTGAELSAQLRYEITRKFAPYVQLAWERRFGETADFARAAGEDAENTSLRAGLRVWF